MDAELKLIRALLKTLEQAPLDAVERARCVEYVAERAYAERDDFEKAVAQQRVDLSRQQFGDALNNLQTTMAAASGCQCPDCQRLRGERALDS